MKSLSLVVMVLLCSVGRVRGDIGPLRDERFPAMCFENLTEYSDFDFYLLYAHGAGNPSWSPYLSRVRSGETFRKFEGKGRKGGAVLLAVPKGHQAPTIVRGRAWLEQIPPDCRRSTQLDGTYLGEAYLNVYRVRFDKDKLEVTLQTSEMQPSEGTREQNDDVSVSWLKRLPWIAASVAFCVAISWLGVWMARRLFAPKSDGAMFQRPRIDNKDNAG